MADTVFDMDDAVRERKFGPRCVICRLENTLDLTEQLHEQGYECDPADIEFRAFGQN